MNPSAEAEAVRRRIGGVLAVGLAVAAGAALSGCTAVTAGAVKERRDAGVSRRYDRPASDLYVASLLALERIRVEHSYWSGLEVIERDPESGTLIAEQRLESALVPGLSDADAIGIFIAPRSRDESEVTVVMLASDQIPGSAGTSMASFKGAETLVYPAIGSALEMVPMSWQEASSGRPAQDDSSGSAESKPKGEVAPTPATASRGASTSSAVISDAALLARVYDLLKGTNQWRPLVLEVRADGGEEIRVGSWARMTASGGRVQLAVREGAGSAAEAARLALSLSQAGFTVDIGGEKPGAGR